MKKKKITKKEIIANFREFVDCKEVMFMYYGGSIAYGTYQEGISDIDVDVIVKDFNGYIHAESEVADYFIYGFDHYLKKRNFDDELPNYFKIYNDVILNIDKNLIYLNPKYKKEYEEYKDLEIDKNLAKFLRCFIDYHSDLISDSDNPKTKRLYHVLRVAHIIRNYEKTSIYSLDLDDKTKELIFAYKNHYEDEIGEKIYKENIAPDLAYLKEVLFKLEGNI